MKSLFTIIFIVTLLVIPILNTDDWLVLSFLIHIIWLIITSNEIIDNRIGNNNGLKVFNKFSFSFIFADIIIMFLISSFLFRILLVPYFSIILYSNIIFMTIFLILNYYLIIDYIINKMTSLNKKVILILSSLFYPIGVYVIDIKNMNYDK